MEIKFPLKKYAGAGMILISLSALPVFAAPGVVPFEQGLSRLTDPGRLSSLLEAVFVLTFLSLVPSLLIMTSSFLRMIVVLGFLRHGMGLQQTPPNHVLLSLALVLTLFVMAPTWKKINEAAVTPYREKTMDWKEASEKGAAPLREFLFKQTRKRELASVVRMSRMAPPKTKEDIPFHVLVTAFVLSELKTAFQIGFVIFIPFLVIDLAVSSVLMSLGMMMVPPTLVSLPLKVLLFVMVDGWNLLAQGLVKSVR